MSHSDNVDHAAQIAGAAILHMKKRGITSNPENFHIWYEYVAGGNAELKATVKALIASGQAFDSSTNRDLYQRYFGPEITLDQSAVWSERIEAVAATIMSALATTEKDTQNYGQVLADFSGGLEGADNPGDIKGMVTSMLQETKAMANQVEHLQTKVSSSTDEIVQLREQLEQTRRDALTDGLTGIPNRKYFDESLRRAATDAIETKQPLSLIIADLDHFKGFNDTHGHQVGDQVLKIVGRTLQQSIKGMDTAARYGGEEFALILPSTSVGGAASLAENLRKTVSSKKLVKKGSDSELGPITMSLGVASYIPGEPLDDFIQRADHALYAAKHAGRNRVMSEDGFRETTPT